MHRRVVNYDEGFFSVPFDYNPFRMWPFVKFVFICLKIAHPVLITAVLDDF